MRKLERISTKTSINQHFDIKCTNLTPSEASDGSFVVASGAMGGFKYGEPGRSVNWVLLPSYKVMRLFTEIYLAIQIARQTKNHTVCGMRIRSIVAIPSSKRSPALLLKQTRLNLFANTYVRIFVVHNYGNDVKISQHIFFLYFFTSSISFLQHQQVITYPICN